MLSGCHEDLYSRDLGQEQRLFVEHRKKEDYYDDPWKWPKIYVENRDEIKNPDLIYPKQVLKIPENGPLTDREKAAAKAYYAKKARAEKAAAEKANKPAETH
jgi:hypothetical protein